MEKEHQPGKKTNGHPMRTTDKNKRYPIPGFHYEISMNGELWNTNTGRLIRLGSDGRYLVRKQKRLYRFSVSRLLYSVEHGVSPDSIQGIVIMTEDKKNGSDDTLVLLQECYNTFQARFFPKRSGPTLSRGYPYSRSHDRLL